MQDGLEQTQPGFDWEKASKRLNRDPKRKNHLNPPFRRRRYYCRRNPIPERIL